MKRWRAVLAELPAPYADALGMWISGASDDEIADRLGVDSGTVAALVEVGHAKAAGLIGSPPLVRLVDTDAKGRHR
jgi:hypothetical protein